MVTSPDEVYRLRSTGMVVGPDGEDVGAVGEVYVDGHTGEPSWVTVKTGWFGTRELFVPLVQALLQGEEVHVPYDKQAIKQAPHFDPDLPLSAADEDQLYRHYGLASGQLGGPESGPGHDGRARASAPVGTAGVATLPVGDSDHSPHPEADVHARTPDQAAPNSHPQLLTDEKVGTYRARLRKYVVTEPEHDGVLTAQRPVTGTDPVPGANR